MPYSSEEGKDFVRAFFSKFHDIRHVIDVGPGAGTYYDLLNKPLGVEWWTAIEIWAPYVHTFSLDKKYNEVIIGDANYVDWDMLGRPDLVIFGDVLEHMNVNHATRILDAAVRISRWVVVSIPIVHYPQGAEMGNPFETHVTHWTPDDVREFLLDGYDVECYTEGQVVGTYILKGDAK